MDSAPMSPADATTVYVSLLQNNLVGLRAERFVNWKRGNAKAVQVPRRRQLAGADRRLDARRRRPRAPRKATA